MQAVSDWGRRAIQVLGHEDFGPSEKVLHRCNHSGGMAWHAGSLNAFRSRASRRRPRGGVLVDLDRTFEVRAVCEDEDAVTIREMVSQ